MSDQNEDLDMFDDLDGDDTSGAGSDSGTPSDAPPADAGADSSKESKRVNGLMSNWQKEKARADKLEARLQALEGKATRGDDAAPTKDEVPESVRQWVETAKDAARDRLFNSDPRFAKYGLDAEFIAGDTPGEMRAAVNRMAELIASVESRVRNELLAEHGLSPETVGGAPAQRQDFGAMSDEDFEKFVRGAKARGGLL